MRGSRAALRRILLQTAVILSTYGCTGTVRPEPLIAARDRPAPNSAVSKPQAAAPVTPAASVTPITDAPGITHIPWGSVDGKPVSLYTLVNKHGLVLKVATYGGIITELHVPDRNGTLADIVLGLNTLEEYQKSSPYFGAIIGRVANRIADAKFELEGKTYHLAANNGVNSLHGGNKGWDKVVWDARPIDSADGPALELSYLSKDGEEGYPGNVQASNTYTLTNQNQLRVQMAATTDRTTIVSMAHHSYWNLAGQGSGTVLEQRVQINAHSYTPSNPLTLVVSGEVKPVKGTPFDFTVEKPIGQDLAAAGGKPVGFDANWVLDGEPRALRQVVRAKDPKSGRVLTVEADQPGVTFYTGNFLDGSLHGKGGATYQQHDGFCIETQQFPNSVNVPAWKERVILRPGQRYSSTMIDTFTSE
ncbi:MAG: aldose epimerase family protein [Polyangiaceae bacterium]